MFHVHPKRSHILLLSGAEFCNCLILLVDGVNSEMEYFVIVVLVVVCFCLCFLFFREKKRQGNGNEDWRAENLESYCLAR